MTARKDWAAYKRAERAKLHAEGFVPVTVWVLPQHRGEIRRYAGVLSGRKKVRKRVKAAPDRL